MEFHFMSHFHHHHLSLSLHLIAREKGKEIMCCSRPISHSNFFCETCYFLTIPFLFLLSSLSFPSFFLLFLLEKERKSSLLSMHCSHAMMELQTCNLQFMVPRKKSHVSPPLLKAHPLSVTSNTFHYMRALKDIERERKQ